MSMERRAELHCHTKMSTMKGLMDAGELVEYAYHDDCRAVAITDIGSIQSFPAAYRMWEYLWSDHKCRCLNKGCPIDRDHFFKVIYGMEGRLVCESDNAHSPCAVLLYAKNETGLQNLYHIVSESYLHLFRNGPTMSRALLEQYREGIIVGAACSEGEIFEAIQNGMPDEEVGKIISSYDFLEISPTDASEHDVCKNIYRLGKACGKPVVAASNAYYLEESDRAAADILEHIRGGETASSEKVSLHFRASDELLNALPYLGEEEARECMEDTARIADMMEQLIPVHSTQYFPNTTDADNQLAKICQEEARRLYGGIPYFVTERLDTELRRIRERGSAPTYLAFRRLVQKSIQDGYLTFERDAIRESLVAFLAGITEINPLYPYYRCQKCGAILEADHFGQFHVAAELPNCNCPTCGSAMHKEGFSIPVSNIAEDLTQDTDIAIHFAKEEQQIIQEDVKELPGVGEICYGGTIRTVTEIQAAGWIERFAQETEKTLYQKETRRLRALLCGVKTGVEKAPGLVIAAPAAKGLECFTPLQHPCWHSFAERMQENDRYVLTHLDVSALDSTLMKLRILGSPIPTLLRRLQENTAIDPANVPIDAPEVLALFTSTDPLGIRPAEIDGIGIGTLALPEFDTDFARNVLLTTKPTTVSHIIKVIGLLHGTDVWMGNMEPLFREGAVNIDTMIDTTREDLCQHFLDQGLLWRAENAWEIAESVSRGQGLTQDMEAMLRASYLPDWFINACKKISYLVPKAHAVSLAMMILRIAWFKLHAPDAFYSAWFSVYAGDIGERYLHMDRETLAQKLTEYRAIDHEMTRAQREEVRVMRVAQEMAARGIRFTAQDT